MIVISDGGTRRIVQAILSAALFTILFLSRCAHSEALDWSGIEEEPTCTKSGYRVVEAQGAICIETIPPLGHQFSEWTVNEGGKSRTHVCSVCGCSETIHISTIPESTFPKLYMQGDMTDIGKKSKVVLDVSLSSPALSFQCYGILTLQGHSTFGYPKKNYTIRFYNDPEGNNKHKVVFNGWNREHKYILKANYVDLSQCRNLAAAGLWADMVASRVSLPERIAALPTYGAVDGFPIAVYLNGEFFGLYTLNLHKDNDLYQMEKGRQEALLICNRQASDESLFRAPAAFLADYSSDWEVEYCGTDGETWAKERFNNLIAFAMSSGDNEFQTHLKDYLDVDGAIDYLIFMYALGLQNSGAKDLVMLTYGDQWIPSAYDMDEAFGLDAERCVYLAPDVFLPVQSEGVWNSGTGSLLWDRLLASFEEQIRDRYQALRTNVLSEEHMIERVRSVIRQVPESFYDYDYYLYADRPVDDRSMQEQIERYILERMTVLDGIFGGATQK